MKVSTKLNTLLLIGWSSFHSGYAEAPKTDLQEFQKEIRPFLNTYCFECHEGEEADAEYRLDNIDGLVTNGNDVERWEKAYEMLSISDMPPSDAENHPDKLTRRKVESWIKKELKRLVVGRMMHG